MLFLSLILSIITPISKPAASVIPVDSVHVSFTYNKMETGENSKNTFFYSVSMENLTNQSVYVIIPKWFSTKMTKDGIMKEVDDDSHDGKTEYSFYANNSFEVYEVKPHSSLADVCKIRIKSDDLAKKSSLDLTIYMAHQIKIGELKLEDYMSAKDFYGNNLTYELVDVNSSDVHLGVK